jgi:hypothetical protein
MPDGNQTLPTVLAANQMQSVAANDAPADKKTPDYDPAPRNLAYLLTAGFFGLLFLLCFHTAPDGNAQILNVVLGSLGTAWVGAMTYFFGSTQAGRAKDWMLYQSRPNSP